MKGTLGPLRPLLCCSRRRRPRPLHRGSRSSARHAVGPRAGHGASLEAVAKRLLFEEAAARIGIGPTDEEPWIVCLAGERHEKTAGHASTVA